MRPIKKREKTKPSLAEMGNTEKEVEYRGKKYQMTMVDKMGEDGVMESHLSYENKMRPKGAKSRGNFATGLRLCLGPCKCPGHPCDTIKSYQKFKDKTKKENRKK